MGGVNHCSLHCRLAKIRGLMIRGKYGAVIGWKGTHSLVVHNKEYLWRRFLATKVFVVKSFLSLLGTYKKMHFMTNHSAVSPPDHQTTEFCRTTVYTTVVDPSLPHNPPWNLTYHGERAIAGTAWFQCKACWSPDPVRTFSHSPAAVPPVHRVLSSRSDPIPRSHHRPSVYLELRV
jgi:hypothetical protein